MDFKVSRGMASHLLRTERKRACEYMRTPEHVWLVVEKDKVVRGEMPSGDPSIYSVPIGIPANEAVAQMTNDNWQVLLDENSSAAGNYRIELVRDNPPE